MKHLSTRTVLLLFAMLCHASLFSQKDFQRHEFSAHTGYGNMVGGVPGLTLDTHSYGRSMQQGVNWDLQYQFRPLKYMVIGMVYSGFSSQGSHAEGSDHVWVHYVGPQIGVCNVSTKRWQVRFGMGPGMAFFRNNSEVFGKTRIASAKTFGLLFNGNTSYKLTPHLGIGIGFQYMLSGLLSMKTRYHGETIRVHFDEESNSELSRVNINAGLSYYF